MHSLGLLALSLEEGSSWLDYPGLEVWKFVNLAVFILAVWYFHRRFGRPISEGLRARGERIKLELERARQEKEQAEVKLAEVQLRLQRLDSEISSIREQAQVEARAERERIKRSTEAELTKLREQMRREIESTSKAAVVELRRFASEQSVAVAEEDLRRGTRDEDDSRMISASVAQLGRGAL